MGIQLRNITKSYNKKLVLDIENFRFRSNKIYCITGPNGVGKTTLLRVIGGLENLDSGDIFYDGRKVYSKETNRKITLVSQSPYLLNTTVYENLRYGMKVRGIPNNIIENKVENVIKKLDILELKNKNANTLSGGEKQKVALGRAILLDTDILLLDEPTSSVDFESTIKMERMIKKYSENLNKIVLIVTHNFDLVKRISDDVLIMNKGKLRGKDRFESLKNIVAV